MYGNLDYARQKLENTVVMYGDKAVLVNEVFGDDDDILMTGSDLRGDEVEGAIEKFNTHSLPLGYANTKQGCIYLFRIPMRQDWRQGLRSRNTKFKIDIDCPMLDTPTDLIMEALETKYPTFEEALELTKDGGKVAFSPSYCLENINGEVNIYFREFRPIGKVVDGEVVVDEGVKFFGEIVRGIGKCL